jgi:hypothetical protein
MRTLVAIILNVFAASAGAQEFAWFSCEHRPDPLTIADAILALGPDLVITQGDAPYTNRGWEAWGMSTERVQFDSVASGPNSRDFNHHYDQMMSNPGWQLLVSGPYDIYSQFDDHEWGGDNWAHNLLTANFRASINATTQADVNYHWRQGRTAWQAWVDTYSQNANATYDIDINTEIPSAAYGGNGAPVPADYPVTYFRVSYGDVEYIFIDTISYRDYSNDSLRNTPVTMLGAQQKAWLINRINASTAEFVVVSSSKTLGTRGTDDAWRYYLIERNEILAALTRTGVLWISGDHHWPAVMRQNHGDVTQWTNINPGPAGSAWSSRGPVNDDSGTLVWASAGAPASSGKTLIDMFGYGYVQNNQLHIQIRSADQTIHYHGYMTPDSNEITTVFAGPAMLTSAGDVNGDGQINAGDLMKAARIIIGLDSQTPQALARWDVAPLTSGVPAPDGQNNIADYLVLAQKILGLASF